MNEKDEKAIHEIIGGWCGEGTIGVMRHKIVEYIASVRREAVAWHPIAIAPKDGTDILLWIPDGREIPIAGRWEPLVVSRKQKWVVDGGMLEDRFPLPTHWMPLLKPPALETAANSVPKDSEGEGEHGA